MGNFYSVLISKFEYNGNFMDVTLLASKVVIERLIVKIMTEIAWTNPRAP